MSCGACETYLAHIDRLQNDVNELMTELATAKRELERWRTGTQIEGDYVNCSGQITESPVRWCVRTGTQIEEIEGCYVIRHESQAPNLGTRRPDNLPIRVEPTLQRVYERGPGEP